MNKYLPYLLITVATMLLNALQAQSYTGPDFNGDGIADLSHVWSDNGSLSVSALLSDGASFAETKWVNQSGSYDQTQRWFYGDFNGDGFTDVAVLWNQGGSMSSDVYIATDTNSDFLADSFVKGSWAVQSGTFAYSDRWFVGDFNGDFSADLARIYEDNGQRSIDVYLSNGTSFAAAANWADRDGDYDGDDVILLGDFNGDFSLDFAVVEDQSTVRIRAHISNGSSFVFQTWEDNGALSRNDAMKWVVEDFNGDGNKDIAALWNDNGQVSINVHESSGSSFTASAWSTQDGTFAREHRWFLGDFNGDFIADIARLWNDNGQLSIESYESSGAGFTRRTLLTQGRAYRDQEDYFVGDFNADGFSDIAVTWADATSWHSEVIASDFNGTGPSTVSQFSTNALGDYFERHNLPDAILGDTFIRYGELSGAVPPGEDLQSVLNSGANLNLVKGAAYNESGTLLYQASYQRISTFDAKFISDYATIRMAIDLGDRDTLISNNSQAYVHLENIAVDGNKYVLGSRERLNGQGQGPMVLISQRPGAWVRRCVFLNTRTWSTVVLNEFGSSADHLVEHNYIIGAGNDPRGNGRAPGELGVVFGVDDYVGWADGFSVAAPNTIVRDNFMMDTTDVGIVLFGAPGSKVQNNVVMNYSRSTHGGINFVDATYNIGFDGAAGLNTGLELFDYRNLTIEDNRVDAAGARVMIGFPLGDATWGAGDTVFDFDGGVLRNNLIEGQAFGYGYALDHVINVNMYGNVSTATHSGQGAGGSPNNHSPDLATAFLYDPTTVTFEAGSQVGDFTTNTVPVVDLLFHHGKPYDQDGYMLIDYTDPEAEATVNAAYMEMLGRTPTAQELTDGKNLMLIDPNPGTPLNEAAHNNGDEFRQSLMLTSEFVNRFGSVPQDNLHIFRTARWRDRIMAHDEGLLISTGNYPDPNVIYDNSEADLVYNLAGANGVVTAISPTLPTYMQQGDTVNVSITVQNTGSVAWANTASDPKKFALASVGDNTVFGVTRVYIPDGTSILPGQSYVFNIDIVAPPVAWAGEGQPLTTFFPYDFRMIQESEGYFGSSISDYLGGTHQIEVENATEPLEAPQYDSTFISMTLQGDPQINGIQPGDQFSVSITMKNSGNERSTNWSKANGFHLGSESPRDNFFWSTNRIFLDNGVEIPFGEAVTFTKILTAPDIVSDPTWTDGKVYDFQWQMLGAGWFGDTTPLMQIAVSTTAPAIEHNDATFVSIDVPDRVFTGSNFSADVTFQNTGESTWTPGTFFKLGNVESYMDRTDEYYSTVSSEHPASESPVGAEDAMAFDNSSSTKYATENASGWVQHQFGQGNQYEITSYAVTSAPDEGPGPEKVSNNSWDSNTTGWNMAADAQRSTADSFSGGASLRIHRTSQGATGSTRQTISGLLPNTDYEISFWMRWDIGGLGALVIDSQDVFDDQMQVVNYNGSPNTWSRFARTFNTGIGDDPEDVNASSFTLRIFGDNFYGTAYVDDISIVQVGAGLANSDPLNWTLQGSNDGTSWTTVDTRSGIDFPNRLQRLVFDVTNSGSYEYYRFDATNNSGSLLQYSELELLTAVTDNVWTGNNRVDMAGGASVLPGENYTFTVNMTAPTVTGDVDYQFISRMIKDNSGDWFGETSDLTVVTVTDTPIPVNDAVFLAQSGIPSTIQPGAGFVANLQFLNTGNTTWSFGDPSGAYKLGAENPRDNTQWGGARIEMVPGASTGPGQVQTFEFVVYAPTTPGTYDFQWGMIQEGIEWFGATSTNVQITVDAGAPPVAFDNATFVSQQVPTWAAPGSTFEVRMTLQNTGNINSWTQAGNYQLITGSADWGVSSIDIDGSTTVAPGEFYEFVAQLSAPATAGTYNCQWQMNVPGRGLFGDLTVNVPIVVRTNTLPIASFADFTGDIIASEGGNLRVEIDAVDPDDGIASVHLYIDGVELARTETNPAYVWDGAASDPELANLTLGSFVLSARAVDNVGAIGPETAITVTVVPAANPVVTWITPDSDITVLTGTTLAFDVGATDADGIDRVRLYKDGVELARSEGTAPYTWGSGDPELVSLTQGTYVFTAQATDDLGNVGVSVPLTVTVVDTLPPTVPVVSFNTPATDTTVPFGSNLYVDVGVTDRDAISQVRLYLDGVQLVRTEGGAPYEWNGAGADAELASLATGTYVLTAEATDIEGQTGTSAPLTITVENETIPLVSFIAPVGDVTVDPGSDLYVNVSAFDVDGIDRVRLYIDDVELARSEGGAPYEWNSATDTDPELQNLAEGSFVLKAIATDNAGSTGEASITVTVAAVSSDPYDPWVDTNFTQPQKDANEHLLDADPDGDGVVNLLEFALGGNPNTSDGGSILPVTTENAGDLDFSFNRGDASLTFRVMKSTDLNSWSEHASNPGSADSSVQVTVPGSEMVAGKLFLRLEVEKP